MNKKINFYICFVRTRKKIDKYFKINKIKNKVIIDIKKIMDEEKFKTIDDDTKNFFKVLVLSKIKIAKDKNKDIYYIPNFNSSELDVTKLLKLKTNIIENDENFNLLLFHEEFLGTNWLSTILDNIDSFDNTQILNDY